MNEGKFKTYMYAAKTIGGDYAAGYQRGLRRHFHGEKFGTEAEHQQWLALDGHRQELGDGYRDGVEGGPPRGFHGNLGNLNAQGELPADSQMQIRLNSQVKARYVKKAQREGMKLSAWVLKTLDAACQDNDHENH
ncbi:hypothetical protein CGX12_11780 [Zobellella denitrificans]|uniref:hypothetical protein n=1 Tax=Zobellella denitrificans TaxID=347534 RepID=UPI000B8C6DBA|nr:hypothetical protein [Zobellella denitrificans]OXS14893.1 hypothetical protein CGX12_11780 [Zobellella denitrificans]